MSADKHTYTVLCTSDRGVWKYCTASGFAATCGGTDMRLMTKKVAERCAAAHSDASSDINRFTSKRTARPAVVVEAAAAETLLLFLRDPKR